MLSEENIERFRKEIADLEILNKLDETLNRDPNCNYEIVSTLLQNAKSKHIPNRVKNFNKRRHKKERWMTDELLAQVLKKITCMVIGKQLQIHIQIMKWLNSISKATKKLYQKVLKKQKKNIFVAYKCGIKKTWQVITEILSRNKKTHDMTSVFNHEGQELADSAEIANALTYILQT